MARTGADVVGIKNNAGVSVNPATEDKQDDIIAGVETPTDIEGLGLQSVGTTAVQLVFSNTTKSIRVSYPVTSTGILYVGKSDVTSRRRINN